ncbi:hypothetical protein BJ546DRAFT_640492 [Cryomyces antarcticus]
MDMDISTPDSLEHSAGGTGRTQQALQQLLGHKIAESPAIPQRVETHSVAPNTETLVLKSSAPLSNNYKIPITKSVLGPKRAACGHCRKRRIRCVHRDTVSEPAAPEKHAATGSIARLSATQSGSSRAHSTGSGDVLAAKEHAAAAFEHVTGAVPSTNEIGACTVKAPTLQDDASEIAFAAEIRRELDAHCRKHVLTIPGRNATSSSTSTSPSTSQSGPQPSTRGLLTQAEAASSQLAGTPKSSSISSLSDREFTDVVEQHGVAREQEHEPASPEQKPWYHLTQLMAMALLDAPDQRLKTADIWNWICEHFPYYKEHDKRSSIGAYLTTESAFEKMKTPNDPPFAPHFHQLKAGFEHHFFTFEDRPLVQPRDSRLSSALQKEKTTREAMAMKRKRVSKSTDHSQPLKRISASRFRRTTGDVINDTFIDNSTIVETQSLTPGTEEGRVLKLKLRNPSKATHIDDTYDTDAPLVSTPLSGRRDGKEAQVAEDVDSPPDTPSSRTLNDSVTRDKTSSIHGMPLAEQQMLAEGEDKENPDSEAGVGLAKLAALRAKVERLDRQRDSTMAEIYCYEHRSEAPKHALMVQYYLENLMKGETGGRDFNGDDGQLDVTMFDEAAKIEEIKRRPSRKATFGRRVKNGGRLRTSGFFSTNRPGPLTCEVDPLRASAKKRNMGSLDFHSLADALGLPRNPIPVFHKGQLAYRDGTLVSPSVCCSSRDSLSTNVSAEFQWRVAESKGHIPSWPQRYGLTHSGLHGKLHISGRTKEPLVEESSRLQILRSEFSCYSRLLTHAPPLRSAA